MRKRRTAVIATGIAAAAVAGGAIGRAAARRRMEHEQAGELMWKLPPQDLGRVRSFDGTEIAVRAAGNPDDPVLLFVHGLTLDMTTWLEQWSDLSVDMWCVVMDQRSHGRSDPGPDGEMSIRAMGRDVAAVLKAVAPGRPAILIGHSLGGISILALGEEHPELFGPSIAGVVLVASAASSIMRGAFGSMTGILRPKAGSWSEALRRFDGIRKAVVASPTDPSGAVARYTQFGPDAPGHIVDHVTGLARRAPSGVWSDGLAEIMELDLREALPNVSVPALVIIGEHDRVMSPAAAQRLASELPRGRAVVIEGGGHMVMLEKPHQVNLEIRNFVHDVFNPPVDVPAPPPLRVVEPDPQPEPPAAIADDAPPKKPRVRKPRSTEGGSRQGVAKKPAPRRKPAAKPRAKPQPEADPKTDPKDQEK
jgi:pimeloyl-ACP methyl ester carboxylesterase